MLRTTSADVTDICIEVGFSSLGTVSRVGEPVPPEMDEHTASKVLELLTKGAMGGWLILTTDDARANRSVAQIGRLSRRSGAGA